jgi:MinD superfamily P-loop ATPase
MSAEFSGYKWLPVVDASKCTGCALCANACGPGCLVMRQEVAVLAEPEVCGSEEHCIGLCTDDAIHMAWVPWSGNRARGLWRADG